MPFTEFITFRVSETGGKDFVKDLVKRVERLADTRVLVGVPSSTAGRLKGDPDGKAVGSLDEVSGAGEKISNNNAALAYIHNFGSPARNIPPRPFLLPGIQNAIPKINRPLQLAATSALSGDYEAMTKALHAIGLICQNEVRRKITMGPFVPLKPATIAARKKRHPSRKAVSAADVRPLIDTGRLRQAQTYAIEYRGAYVFQNPVSNSGKYSKVKD